MIGRSLCAAIALSMVMVVPFLSFQGAGASPESAISVETIDVQGNATECCIALGPDGTVHVAFFDQDTGALRYASNAGGHWAVQTISSGLAMSACSLAVDSQGNAYLSYVGGDDQGYGDLIYATNADGAWDNQLIDDGEVLGYTSMAVDARDKVHISYHTGGSYENDNLRYASDKSGQWATELVDDGQAGWYSTIAVDPEGSAHIAAYAGIGSKPLRYSTNAGGAWSSQDIEASVWVGGQCSIAIDSTGAPHVAASTSDELSQVDMKHAVYSAGTWISEDLEFGGYVWSRSIAIDGQDATHICYRLYPDDALMYKTNVGGSWTTIAVDQTADSVSHASMAVSGDGEAHICYIATDSAGSHLRYARIGVDQVTGPPAAPTGLTTSVVDGAVQLVWNPPQSDQGSAVTSYVVYRGTGLDNMVSIATVNSTSYLDDDLEAGGTVFYKIVAVNANGMSEGIHAVVSMAATEPISSNLEDPPLTGQPVLIIGAIGLVAALSMVIVLLLRRRTAI